VTKRRKWWTAGLLSLITPGLGQLYNGQVLRAAVLYFVPLALVAPGCLLIARAFSKPMILVTLVAVAAYRIGVVIEAALQARRLSPNYVPRKFNRWYVYFLAFVCASAFNAALAGFVKGCVLRAFKFPSGSMEPTLVAGDHVLADMTSSGRKPARGDLVVFVYPKDPSKDFLKRVVAVAGDKVEVREKVLFVNDAPQQEPYVIHTDKATIDPKEIPRDNFGPLVVPTSSYFVMGDNRDKSYDSRFWGPVAANKIHGRVVGIYWSWDARSQAVRWSRIGRQLGKDRVPPTNG